MLANPQRDCHGRCLFVAEAFGKHFHVLRACARLTESKSGLSEGAAAGNYFLDVYKGCYGPKTAHYLMTSDGFTMLIMGYTGPKAMHFKELYIQRFNEMEQCIRSLLSARQEFPMLTDIICRLHENPKPAPLQQ